jgi:DNA-directed RNA polymerase specialized sigma24 family protein
LLAPHSGSALDDPGRHHVIAQGRPESLDAALAILQNTVFSFSMKVCGHREDAEDTMQETLLRAARQLPNFESPEALNPKIAAEVRKKLVRVLEAASATRFPYYRPTSQTFTSTLL